MLHMSKCLSLFLSLLYFYCFRYFQVSLFRILSLFLFSPDSKFSFSFTGLYPVVLCSLILIIVSYHSLLFVQSLFIDPFFKPMKRYLPLISFLLNLSFFTISFFLVAKGDFYLWLLEVFFFVLYFSFVYFVSSKLLKA